MPNEPNKPKIKLSSRIRNSFTLIGLAKNAARKARWTEQQIDAYEKEAMSDDYYMLLQTTMKYFDIE